MKSVFNSATQLEEVEKNFQSVLWYLERLGAGAIKQQGNIRKIGDEFEADITLQTQDHSQTYTLRADKGQNIWGRNRNWPNVAFNNAAGDTVEFQTKYINWSGRVPYSLAGGGGDRKPIEELYAHLVNDVQNGGNSLSQKPKPFLPL